MPDKRSVIALLTDFGTGDWYVGVMKGVILSINPRATIVDLTHAVPRQDVTAASFALTASYRFLPPDAIVVTVVDPGVGTGRRIICAGSAGRLFLAPDNGVLTEMLEREGLGRLVAVENEDLFLKPMSSTFHGRDIFAPVAGHLSLGIDLGELGPAAEDCRRLDIPGPVIEAGSVTATVRWIDSFGNVITDCLEEDLKAILDTGVEGPAGTGGRLVVEIGEKLSVDLVTSYESVTPGQALAIVGSSGYLEISVREGSAGKALGLGLGDRIRIR